MRYGIFFLALAISLVAYGGWLWPSVPLLALLLWWAALSFALIGVAYITNSPQLLGKTPDGHLPWSRRLPLLPYLALMVGTWWLDRWRSRVPAYQEVMPGLWIGRRLLPHEYPKEIDRVLDLTAEFPASAQIVATKEYICLPILDAMTPDLDDLKATLQPLVTSSALYIHCAQGHGRTGTVAAALLLLRGTHQRDPDACTPQPSETSSPKDIGEIHNAEEALAWLQSRRPSLRINAAQMDFLREFQRQHEYNDHDRTTARDHQTQS